MRNRIERGYWAKGDKISSLEQLGLEFAVARLTVRQAIDILCGEQLLSAQPGRGTFVVGRPEKKRWLNLSNNLRSLAASVLSNVFKLVSVEEDVPPPRLTKNDGKAAPSYVFLKSVQFDGERQLSVVRLHLAKHLFEMDREHFMQAAALPRLVNMESVSIARAYQSTMIGVAELETAKLLQIELGEPIADCRLVIIDSNDVAIYVADIHYHRNCFAMRVDLLNK